MNVELMSKTDIEFHNLAKRVELCMQRAVDLAMRRLMFEEKWAKSLAYVDACVSKRRKITKEL